MDCFGRSVVTYHCRDTTHALLAFGKHVQKEGPTQHFHPEHQAPEPKLQQRHRQLPGRADPFVGQAWHDLFDGGMRVSATAHTQHAEEKPTN